MHLHDPSNRLGKAVPFAETASDFTIEGAKNASRNCEKCGGCGFAAVFNPRYQGSPVEIEVDPRQGRRQVLMRANAYCVCPMGRKVAVLHQQASKDVFLRTPDYHDVVAGKYYDWQAEDPTYDPTQAIDASQRPEAFRRLLESARPRIYHEPDSDHDRINRMFDDESEAV